MNNTMTGPWLVECFNGHVCEVLPGTELEKQCIALEKQGRISAKIIGSDDCLGCWLDEHRNWSEYMNNYYDWDVCPDHNQHGCYCSESCSHKRSYLPQEPVETGLMRDMRLSESEPRA